MYFWKNIRAVIIRELEVFKKRPVYFLGSVGVVSFCAVFFLTFLGDGLPHDIPIGVVDEDNSSVSRMFVRHLDATQLGKTVRFDTFPEARLAMQKGEIYAVCILPKGMYSDIGSFRRPTFTYYINGMYFLGGSLAYKDLLTIINLANGAAHRKFLRAKGWDDRKIMNFIKPIEVDTHQIGNAYTSYNYYLSNLMLPAILEMVIVILMIYALGSELKYGTSRHLLRTGGGSIVTVLGGKIIVYTTLFTAIGMSLVFLLYDWLHFPIAGSVWNMFPAMFLLVMASEAVGIFIIGLLPVPRLALSIGALYSVLAISFTGFTLPVEAMPAAIRGLAQAFPLRHYYMIFTDEVILGSGFAAWWPEAIHLFLFQFLPLAVMIRLKRAFIYQNYPKE
ncbi:MAG: ABC transporter permease [Bacteroidota bacterium]|nr:ABC transporter permease [Bacteroidota bacterium]